MSEPHDRKPGPGRRPTGYRAGGAPGGKPYGGRDGIDRASGTRPFRGGKPARADSGSRRPSRDKPVRPRENVPCHEEHSPDDPIAAYLTGREAQAGASRARFVSPFSAPKGARADLEAFLSAVSETIPVHESRRRFLLEDVQELWRGLTSERGARSADYMGKPSALAAYIRYFMAWNVVRMVPVLAGLPLDLPKGAKLLDIGSGPLTLPIALWIARPELRDRGLRILCTDRIRKAMETGLSILDALRLKTGGPILGEGAWKIETRRAVFPNMEGPVKADVVASANAFTEFFWSSSGRERTLGEKAEALVGSLSSSCKPEGTVLLIEPGEPRSGAMLSALREAALLAGFTAEAPCPHARACPMSGAFGGMGDREDGRAKSALPQVHTPRHRTKMPWCHFPVPLDIAPPALTRFSEEAGLPKNRLTVSWLALKKPAAGAKAPETTQKGPLLTRLVSDLIRLPGGWEGRYACSDLGYTLVVGPAAKEAAGSLLELPRPARVERDEKSGAVLVGP